MFVADLTITTLSGSETPKIIPYRVYAPNGTLTSVGLPVLGLTVVTIRQTDCRWRHNYSKKLHLSTPCMRYGLINYPDSKS